MANYIVRQRWDDDTRILETDPFSDKDAGIDLMNKTVDAHQRSIMAGNIDPSIQCDYVEVVRGGVQVASKRVTRKADPVAPRRERPSTVKPEDLPLFVKINWQGRIITSAVLYPNRRWPQVGTPDGKLHEVAPETLVHLARSDGALIV